MIIIELGNIGNQQQAEKIKNKIEGKTYYNFIVDYAPAAGNYPVTVSTDYPNADESEAKDMLMFLLASEL